MNSAAFILTRRISPFLGVVIILIFTFILASAIIFQAQKLSALEKPLPLLISPQLQGN